jgi:formate C-acetyltransferase
MEKGVDVIEGGAIINSSGVTIIGLADTADSLSAIEKVVFDERSISFPGFMEALQRNFEGNEALSARLTNPEKTPKWGNEDRAADSNVEWIIRLLDRVYSSENNYRGGRYRVGYWTMTAHAGFGLLTQALPNGRKARENFSSGITPVSEVTPYLTRALNSIAAMPARCLSSGVAFNLKFTPESPPDHKEMLDRFAATVDAYFRGPCEGGTGGMEIQFNITRREDFEDARKHPERHPELLVRVSGYTAYFKDLNPQMQQEIIDRTEYELASGTAVSREPFRLR